MSGSIRVRLNAASTATEYQRIVLEEVRAGHHAASWFPLAMRRGGRSLIVPVLSQPLALRDPSGGELTYVMASATLQQLLADELSALLPTSLVMDEIHRQATGRVPPIVHPAWVTDNSMGTPPRLVEQSDALTTAIGALANRTLVSDGWKSWIASIGFQRGAVVQGAEQAFNLGLYSQGATGRTPGGEHVIQSIGGAHNRLEIDYSQVVVLMSALCTLDGVSMHTADVLANAPTASLLSDEGALGLTRQPGKYDGTVFGAAPGTPHPGQGALPLVRRGSTGPDVRRWQQILGVAVDGSFGPDTEAHTRTWQAAHGLIADGIVGPATWAAAANTGVPPAAPTTLEGIDVSSNNGTIDWAKVKAAGIGFAYLRAGEGVGWEDPSFSKYAEGAREVGLPIGAYHLLLPRAGTQDAAAQAQQFVARYQREGCALRPAVDCEDSNATRGRTGAEWAAAIRQWVQTVENALGVAPFIYTYPGFWASFAELREASDLAAYPLWIAHYAPPPAPTIPPPWKTKAMWQWAAGAGVLGVVDGVPGHVDRDRFWGTVDDLAFPL